MEQNNRFSYFIIMNTRSSTSKAEPSFLYSMLQFDNIGVSVGDKVILNNVCGKIKNNELVGVVGTSGGGKTTLLSILSGRLYRISSLSTKNYKVEQFICICIQTFQLTTKDNKINTLSFVDFRKSQV